MVASFKHQFSGGHLGQGAYRVLLFAAEDAGDEIDSDEDKQRRAGETMEQQVGWEEEMKEHVIKWDSLRGHLVVNNYLENFADVRTLGIGSFIRKVIYEKLTFGIDIANGYLSACRHVHENIVVTD
jgi:hypothetical protein